VQLVLEVHSEADKPHGHVAAARMTSGAVTLTYGDARVWKTMWLLDPLERALPDVLDERNKIAYGLVPEFLNHVFGPGIGKLSADRARVVRG
jgi:hypothetical protein